MRNILLISKEVLRPDYLSCYGSKLYKTPHIDALAKSGTIFTNFYTASPSSAMAFTAMFTGLYPFETKRKSYREERKFDLGPTLSDLLEEKGYEIHVIWGGKWFRGSHKRSRVFSATTQFHNLEDIYQLVGPHYLGKDRIKPDPLIDPLITVYEEIRKIFERKTKPVFIWLHCPHVFFGRTGYGSDIDMFDKLLSMLFRFFSSDEIYLTGDHGHMNCAKSIPVYGFHVYEGAIKVPLITPNHFGKKIVEDLLSNVQLKDIILNQRYEKSEFIYSDTQYFLQENRRLMIRKGDFKYIYSKRDKSEELYDLRYDEHEEVNILLDNWLDRNRDKFYYLEEIYYYPRWPKAKEAYKELREERQRIWKDGRYFEKMIFKLNDMRKKGIGGLSKYSVYRKTRMKGRWDSSAKISRYDL